MQFEQNFASLARTLIPLSPYFAGSCRSILRVPWISATFAFAENGRKNGINVFEVKAARGAKTAAEGQLEAMRKDLAKAHADIVDAAAAQKEATEKTSLVLEKLMRDVAVRTTRPRPPAPPAQPHNVISPLRCNAQRAIDSS